MIAAWRSLAKPAKSGKILREVFAPGRAVPARRRAAILLLCGWKRSSEFEDFPREIIRDVSLVARFDQISGAEELLLARAQSVADGLLHLHGGELAFPGCFLGEQFQDAIAAVLHWDRLRHLANLH